jgi:hypothetical protein
LTEELEQEKANSAGYLKELQLARELIKQLEIKVERQAEEQKALLKEAEKIKHSSSKLNIHANDNGPSQEDKEKMEKIVSLVTQLKQLVIPNDAKDPNVSSVKLLWEEKSAHDKTKQVLADEQQKAKEDKAKIVKLEKRIQDLLKSTHQTLRRMKDPSILYYTSLWKLQMTLKDVLETLGPEGESESEYPTINGRLTMRRHTSLIQPPVTSKPPSPRTLPKQPTNPELFATMAKEDKIQKMFGLVENGKSEDLALLIESAKFLITAADSTGQTALHKVRYNYITEANILQGL